MFLGFDGVWSWGHIPHIVPVLGPCTWGAVAPHLLVGPNFRLHPASPPTTPQLQKAVPDPHNFPSNQGGGSAHREATVGAALIGPDRNKVARV